MSPDDTFFVEARQQGTDHVWRPIPSIFGVGRYQVDDATQGEAEIRLWQRTARGRVYEYRVRRVKAPAPAKTEPQRVAEVAKQESIKGSLAKSLTQARKAAARTP